MSQKIKIISFFYLFLFLSPSILAQTKSIIQFETETYDFGTINEGNQISYDFEFINLGPSKVFIDEAKVSCPCTIVKYPQDSVAIGEKAQVSLSFNTEGREGKFAKSVIVYSNSRQSVKVLYITGTIEKTMLYASTNFSNTVTPYRTENLSFENQMFLSPKESSFLRE